MFSFKKSGIVFTVALCFSASFLFSQTFFQKSFSNLGFEKGSCVIKTNDGGYLQGGTTGTGTFGPDKMYLVKTDYAGSVLWSKTYAGTISEYLASVIQTNDGGYILCGTTYSFNTQPYGDIWIIKTDASGTITWQNHYGYTGYDYGYSIQQTMDGGYVVGGLTSSFGAGYYDYFIMKIDSVGNAAWGTTIGGTGNDYAYSVLQNPDGSYMIAGQENSYSFTSFNPYQIMLCKLNSTGTVLWSKSYGGGNAGGNYICYNLRKTTDGGYVMTGWTDGVGAGLQDVYVLKVDSAGGFQWAKTYGGTNSDFGNDIRQTANGGYAIAGYTKSFGAGNDDAYLITTDANGNMLWSVCYGDTAIDRANALDQTADGGFIISGQTSATGSGNADFYLIKCDNSGYTGCFENDPVTLVAPHAAVETTINPLVSSNALWTVTFATVNSGCVATTLCSTVGISESISENQSLSVFPNPSDGKFTVQSEQIENGTIEIFDTFGKLILSEKNFNYQKEIDMTEHSKGMYLVKVSDGKTNFVRKVILD